MVRPALALVLLSVLATAACGSHAMVAAPPPLPSNVPPFPYVALLHAAAQMGDPTPTSAVWVKSRHQTAVAATMRDSVLGNQPVYVAVITGHFRDTAASYPAGGKAPTGTVATFVYDARTGLGTDFGLAKQRIALGRLGAVHDFLPYLRQAARRDLPATIETQWLQRLSAGSRLGCTTEFRNRSASLFSSRLNAAARANGFHVLRLQFLRACQSAPLVFVSSSDPHRLVPTLAGLERALDRVNGNRAWAYEGFFFEAVNGSGEPFVVFWNHVRAEVAGGQWASAPDLYPFAHG